MPILSDDRSARSLDHASGYTAQVYVARRATDGALKVGATSDPAGRMQTLSSSEGQVVELLATGPGGYRREHALHRKLVDDRIGNTEWYRPTGRVRRLLAELIE